MTDGISATSGDDWLEHTFNPSSTMIYNVPLPREYREFQGVFYKLHCLISHDENLSSQHSILRHGLGRIFK